jgi:hypothetical protein
MVCAPAITDRELHHRIIVVRDMDVRQDHDPRNSVSLQGSVSSGFVVGENAGS